MIDLKNYFRDIWEKMKNLTNTLFEFEDEWGNLLDGIAEEQWDCDQFKKTVLKTYEYFKSLYERSNLMEEHYSRVPLDACELGIIAMVYAYGRAEIFCPIRSEDDYERYASYFIATALYYTIKHSNLRAWLDQEIYTVMDEFKYCSPDGEAFMFEYNVKTGDMTEIVDIIRLFDESGWLYERHCRNYKLPSADFIKELKESLESDD